MITVTFPRHLRRFVDLPESCEATGGTLREVLDDVESRFPGVRNYLLHENGQLRQHVNLFLDQRLVTTQNDLNDPVAGATELTVMQALSGG